METNVAVLDAVSRPDGPPDWTQSFYEYLKENPLKALMVVCTLYLGNAFVCEIMKRQRIHELIDLKSSERRQAENALKGQIDVARAKEGQDNVWQTIREMKIEDLLGNLRSGNISAVDALQAFQSRALDANERLNCVVNFLPEAVVWARRLDEIPTEERGPLHGLPISVKECYNIEGCDSTAGMSIHLFDPAKSDSAAVEQLRSLGAVPFCQTNVPQTMFSMQTSNPAYGETGNPYDFDRECGGSSGGEGSLIGAGGSIVGIGNDIGGSLRNPAALCATVSLKPTFGRHLSQLKVRSPVEFDPVAAHIVGGFLARDVDSLMAVWKIIWDTKVSDPHIAPIPWNELRLKSERFLKIGYYVEDGYLQAHPGSVRAVQKAADLLRNKGHVLFPIDPPDMEEVFHLYSCLIMCDWGNAIRQAFASDIYDSSTMFVRALAFLLSMPKFIQYIIGYLGKGITKLPLRIPFATGEECVQGLGRTSQLLETYHQYLDSQNCDVMLTPASYYPAPIKGTQGSLGAGGILPTIPWNLLDMPAGIVPITKVTDDDDKNVGNMPDNDSVYLMLKPAIVGAIGLPLAVQVVGRRFDEEIVLRVMKELEDLRTETIKPDW